MNLVDFSSLYNIYSCVSNIYFDLIKYYLGFCSDFNLLCF